MPRSGPHAKTCCLQMADNAPPEKPRAAKYRHRLRRHCAATGLPYASAAGTAYQTERIALFSGDRFASTEHRAYAGRQCLDRLTDTVQSRSASLPWLSALTSLQIGCPNLSGAWIGPVQRDKINQTKIGSQLTSSPTRGPRPKLRPGLATRAMNAGGTTM